MRSQIKNYLSITKKEWNGMVVLIILIALIFAAPYVYQLLHKDTTINTKDFDAAVALLDQGKRSQKAGAPAFYKKAAPSTVIELNTADSATLTQLHGIGGSFAKRI